MSANQNREPLAPCELTEPVSVPEKDLPRRLFANAHLNAQYPLTFRSLRPVFDFDKPTGRLSTISLLVVHRSTSNLSFADTHRVHRDVRHWFGIGYHFWIERCGAVLLGRPWNLVGAHAKPYNRCSYGICLAGGDAPPTTLQLRTCGALITRLVQSDVDACWWAFHREVAGSRCPGDSLQLQDLKPHIAPSVKRAVSRFGSMTAGGALKINPALWGA